MDSPIPPLLAGIIMNSLEKQLTSNIGQRNLIANSVLVQICKCYFMVMEWTLRKHEYPYIILNWLTKQYKFYIISR